jgi:hypothetical protein
MPWKNRSESFGEHYRRGLGEAARHKPDIFLFGIDASVPFAITNAVLSGGFRQRVEREPPVALSLAMALSVVSSARGRAGALVGGGSGDGRPASWGRSTRPSSTCSPAAERSPSLDGPSLLAGTSDLDKR